MLVWLLNSYSSEFLACFYNSIRLSMNDSNVFFWDLISAVGPVILK